MQIEKIGRLPKEVLEQAYCIIAIMDPVSFDYYSKNIIYPAKLETYFGNGEIMLMVEGIQKYYKPEYPILRSQNEGHFLCRRQE